jgi:hypothetical protein
MTDRRELLWLAAALGGLMALQLWFCDRGLLLRCNFWMDEINSWTLITDPSWRHAWHALGGGFDDHPPLFYVLARLWAAVLGAGEVSLRLFALLSTLLGLLGLHAFLRLRWSAAVALAGVCTAWANPLVLSQAVNARMYAPWFAAQCWLLYWWERSRNNASRLDRGAIAALSMCACVLHYFGVLGVLLMVSGDACYHRRWDSRAWAAMCGPLALLACLPLLVSQRAALTPGTTWVEPLDVHTAFAFLHDIMPGWQALVMAAFVLVVMRSEAGENILAAPVLGLFLLPVMLLLASYWRVPMNVDRYAVPFACVAPVAMCWAVSRLSSSLRALLLIGLMSISTGYLLEDTHASRMTDIETQSFLTYLHHKPQAPIIYDAPLHAYVLAHYAPDVGQRMYMLDFAAGQLRRDSGKLYFLRDLSRAYCRFYQPPRLMSFEELRSQRGAYLFMFWPEEELPNRRLRHLMNDLWYMYP